MFRFFPTIVEEYHGITDAMRLRNVGSFRNPVDMLEYRLVPLMISLTAIGNDLSISALTRGLDAPNKRSNMCAIGFNVQDYIAIAVSVPTGGPDSPSRCASRRPYLWFLVYRKVKEIDNNTQCQLHV